MIAEIIIISKSRLLMMAAEKENVPSFTRQDAFEIPSRSSLDDWLREGQMLLNTEPVADDYDDHSSDATAHDNSPNHDYDQDDCDSLDADFDCAGVIVESNAVAESSTPEVSQVRGAADS